MKNLHLSFVLIFSLVLISSCTHDDSEPETQPTPTSITDVRDGQQYDLATIGTQTWISSNLNFNPENDGALYYDHDSLSNHVYGRLYLYEIVMNGESSSTAIPSGVRGLCPEGFHLPSIGEWEILQDYLSEHDLTGNDLKAPILWTTTSYNTNSTGFSALPAGTMYDPAGAASANITTTTGFISTSATSASSFSGVTLDNGGSFMNANLGSLNRWSCRCLMD